MSYIILSALGVSLLIYLAIGFISGKQTSGLADLIPVILGKKASVKNSNEFSASTVATTISLATVILAYFELSEYFGLWLLWTAITTSAGLALVSVASRRIWTKLSSYDHRPSLHEFLGKEFNSKSVALIGAICTSFGFLLVFATELIVGSRFLAALVPEVPEWLTTVVLAAVGFVYTAIGGFRAVVKTDQIQMKFIWVFIAMLSIYYITFILNNGGLKANLSRIPTSLLDFSNRPGLFSFLAGIAIMNIPLYISNMSIWQRISGSQEPETIAEGLKGSIFSSFLSWSLLVILAVFAFMIIPEGSAQSLLPDLLKTLVESTFGKIVLFFVVLGLYGAMLSTASTNLIVVAHTLYEDIFAPFRRKSLSERVNSEFELSLSRIILLSAALLAVGLVVGLKYLGFSIADLAFAIYGGGLALCPAVITALYAKEGTLHKLSTITKFGIVSGFLVGWGSAISGKLTGNADLVFLSPCISFGISTLIMLAGLIFLKRS